MSQAEELVKPDDWGCTIGSHLKKLMLQGFQIDLVLLRLGSEGSGQTLKVPLKKNQEN
jgi:hypothetical protein